MEYTNKDQPPAFLLKTYMMIDDPSTDGTVSWNIDGTGFVVWRLAEFARDLLPTIFKHGNFASFIRQLNTYGFHKLSPDRWEFENKLFCRGQIDQLHKICRKKQTPNKPRHDVQLPKAQSRFQFCDNGGVRGGGHVPSTSSQYTILVDENRKLQQENTILNSELSVVKKRFDKLLDLATIYGRNSNEVKSNSVGPKIFGVRLNAGERADMEN